MKTNSKMAVGIFVSSVVVLLLLVFMLPQRPAKMSSTGFQCKRPLTVSKKTETEEELQDMPKETYDVGIGTSPVSVPSDTPSPFTSPILPISTSNPTTGPWTPVFTTPVGGPAPSALAYELNHGNSTLLSQEATLCAQEDEEMLGDDETSRDNDEMLVLYWSRLHKKGVQIIRDIPAKDFAKNMPLVGAIDAERERVGKVFDATLGAHRPWDYNAIATYLRNFHWLTADGQEVQRVELAAVDGLLTLTNKPLQRDWAAFLSDFYARYNPDKNNSEHIAKLLAYYAGRDNELLEKLYKTYNIEPEETNKPPIES
jgi:hypothetical protein